MCAEYSPPSETPATFNPANWIPQDGEINLSNYLTTGTAQNITGAKTYATSTLKVKDSSGGGTSTVNYVSVGDSTTYNLLSNTSGGTQFIVSDLVSMPLYNKNLSDATNTFPRNYYIVYGGSGSQSIASNSNFTTTTNALWAGSTSNQSSGTISWTGGTGTFTVNDNGLYMVSASCSFAGSTAAGQRAISIACSDGQTSTSSTADNSSPAFSVGLTITTMFVLSATATINCSVRQMTGSSLNATTSAGTINKFMVYKIL